MLADDGSEASEETARRRGTRLGFDRAANLDKGAMWPTSFALMELTPTEDKKIKALVRKAVS